ncbi:RagB/SusD family nutrient uptake outer membrane protein [Pedobacter nanyangensis]|uniref:RagB/SusD family nutrient uptake outer membrane protein n=1 Tax=Pedobacter nanyangensis TaxID=1562389 RepID=UPI000DE3B0E5|nr:RagB/SusD family nutrient uptake outer membrane protein [Pedobacter nanyangensis]
MKIFKKQSPLRLQGKFNWLIIYLLCLTVSCKKFVEVNNVTDQLYAAEVFDNRGTANSAIAGIYSTFKQNLFMSATSSMSIFTGLASDELKNRSSSITFDNYFQNNLFPQDMSWAGNYNTIYLCNAAIERLEKSSLAENVKNPFIGEAKFLRALNYYFLVNQYGAVPLVLATDVEISSKTVRTPVNEVYAQMIADLLDAQTKLNPDYSFNSNNRTRANKWVATGLLARIYLHTSDFAKAEIQSNAVIQSGLYNLIGISSQLYGRNNNEAIFQITNLTSNQNYEAVLFLPSTNPNFVLTSSMTNSFEPNDQRKEKWTKRYTVGTETFYTPFKFTVTAVGNTEQTTLLRLAEQYLIRAESRIQQNKIADGVADLNILRTRASLPSPNHLVPIADNISKENALLAVERERRNELFAENGLRWYDIKRTGRVNTIMALEKPGTWKATAALWPIPLGDIQKFNSITQNPGYE